MAHLPDADLTVAALAPDPDTELPPAVDPTDAAQANPPAADPTAVVAAPATELPVSPEACPGKP